MAAVCSVCKKKDQKYVTVEWCTECEKVLCSTCSQKHKQDTMSKDHDTLSYSDYQQLPPLIKNLNQTCADHREKFLYLCREHDQLICSKCLKTKHTKCGETPVLKDIVRNVKTSHAFDDVTSEIGQTSNILQNGIKELQHNLNEFHKQRKEMVKTVEDSMDRIMKEVNKLKNNMLSDIDGAFQKHEKDVVKTMVKLETMEKEFGEITDQKHSITLHATNLQTYFAIKMMETVLDNTTKCMTGLSENGDLDNINIGLNQTKSIETLFKEVKLFGEIKVTKKAADLSLETSKPQEAQNMTHTLPQQLQLQQKVDLGHGNHYGCCSLPSGIVVVNDCINKQLKFINTDGTMKSTITFEVHPVDVTTVDETCVAVSHDTTISMIDVSTGRVTRSWHTGKYLGGVSYRDDYITYCAKMIGIKRINIGIGTIDSVINDKDVDHCSHVVSGIDRICYTCPGKNTVTVLNLQHDVIFKYKSRDRLKHPLCVTLDSNNNVYVTGDWSYNVLAISHDGERIHVLLSKDDGLWEPTGINYDGHTKQLTVITRQHSTLCKYSLGC